MPNINKYSRSIDLIMIVLLAFSACFYLIKILARFPIWEVKPYAVILIISVLVFLAFAVYYVFKRDRKIPPVLCFFLLFLIYILRVPNDIFSTYLWAEDGCYLIQDAVFSGPLSVFNVTNGTHWLVPRAISLICYWICCLFGNLTFLPALQGIFCKLIATGCIALFLSERFDWIIKERVFRFVVCACVIFAIPYYAIDVAACDTSLPFAMNFAVFLIGFDTLCGNNAKPISLSDTILLSVIALSNAASPFPAAVAVFAFARWLCAEIKGKRMCVKTTVIESVKVIVVLAFALVQFWGIVASSRSHVELRIIERIGFCFTHFVFQPYYYSYLDLIVFFFAFAGWMALIVLARLPWRSVVFISAYSFAFLLYCTLVADFDEMEYVIFREADGGARYILLPYMIAAFLLALEICVLLKKDKVRRIIGLVLSAIVIVVSTLTYPMELVGYEYSDAYRDNIGVFDPAGKQSLCIPIGPWTPWDMQIPWNINRYSEMDSEDLSCSVSIEREDAFYGSRADELIYLVPVEVLVGDADGSLFRYVFIDAGDDMYLAPAQVSADQEDGKTLFLYYVNYDCTCTDTMRFIGITEDDQICVWEI